MSVSDQTSGLMTAQDFVQAAAEDLGYLSAGEDISGEDLALGLRQLNWLLKSLTARGVNLWREEEVTLSVTAAATLLDQSVDNVLSARVQVNTSYERPIFPYTRAQYFALPNKAAPGSPTAYYVDRQRDQATLYLWPVPATAATVILDVARVIDDVTDPTQTLDVPQKWSEAIYCALAARLAGPFGVTRTDPASAQRVEQRAAAFEQLLLNEDRPASIYMGSEQSRWF